MLEVFLEDPGIIFEMASGRVVRTPIKFIIEKKERKLYESLIRVSPVQNFTITKTDKTKPIRKKNSRLMKGRPGKASDLNLSIQLK